MGGIVVVALLIVVAMNLYLAFHSIESDRRSTALSCVESALNEYYSRKGKFPASLPDLNLSFATSLSVMSDEELAGLMTKLQYHTTAEGYTLTWSDGFGQRIGIIPPIISCPMLPSPFDTTSLVPLTTTQSN